MKEVRLLHDFVLEKVDLMQIMIHYGVDFVYSPKGVQEAQYRCPFHGRDNKPSARLYRETKSCWCWKCHKMWNVIDFVRDKENLGYVQAILFLIGKYRLDTSSIPDAPVLALEKPPDARESEAKSDFILLKNKIREKRGDLPLDKYSALCTAWYMISYAGSKGADISGQISKLSTKMEFLCNTQKSP